MTNALTFLLPFCALIASTAAHGQSGAPARSGPPAQGDTVTVGLGLGVTTSYDGGRDYRIIPGGALLGTIDGHDFRLNGLQLFVDFVPNNRERRLDIELGPVAGVAFNRTGSVSDNRVAALGKLETAVELGGRGAIGVRGLFNRSDKLAFAVTGVRDVVGAHGSHVINPSIEYSTLAGRSTFLRMAFATEFVGKGWADYNFGIDEAGAAASGLARHDLEGGLASIGTSVLATHSLSGQRTGWALFGVASYKRLQGDIAASPIVRETGSPNQFFASLGVGYTF